MDRQQILELLTPLNEASNNSRRLQWLTEFGFQMTISARAGYRGVEKDTNHLIAFNEMQHQVYNYMRHPQEKEPWRIEDFAEGLRQYAEASGVAGHFGAAFLASLRFLN